MSIQPVENQRIYAIAFAILFAAVVIFITLVYTFPAHGQVNIVSGIRTPTPAQVKQPLPESATSKPERSILSSAKVSKDDGAGKPLRSRIKVVVYSMDHCIPCVKLHDAIESELPKAGWKLGTAKGHVEACESDADIVFVHHPAGEELFTTYPTVCVYSNGRFVKRFWGSMTAAQVARKWLEQYEAELSQ